MRNTYRTGVHGERKSTSTVSLNIVTEKTAGKGQVGLKRGRTVLTLTRRRLEAVMGQWVDHIRIQKAKAKDRKKNDSHTMTVSVRRAD